MGNVLVKSSIKHAGVKGMKWGKRKKEDETGDKPLNQYTSAEEFYTRRMGASVYNNIPTPYRRALEDYWSPDNRSYWNEDDDRRSTKDNEKMVEFFYELQSFIDNNDGVSSFAELNQIEGERNSMEIQGDPGKINDLTEAPDAIENLNKLYYHEDEYSPEEAQKIFAQNAMYTMNCTNCAAAYELRRRGYDVEAMPYAEHITQNLQEDIAIDYQGGLTWLGVQVEDKSKTEANTKEFILKNSSGDQRGYVLVDGHIFNYEVVKKKVNWIDGQAPKINSLESSEIFTRTTTVQIVRTDNKVLSDNVLARIRNRNKE